MSTSSGYGKMHHCRKRRHFPLLSVTKGVDTSVRALRNYFLYGNMDCVGLLVVNRGRKKGALQQEVDDEVHTNRGRYKSRIDL